MGAVNKSIDYPAMQGMKEFYNEIVENKSIEAVAIRTK